MLFDFKNEHKITCTFNTPKVKVRIAHSNRKKKKKRLSVQFYLFIIMVEDNTRLTKDQRVIFAVKPLRLKILEK